MERVPEWLSLNRSPMSIKCSTSVDGESIKLTGIDKTCAAGHYPTCLDAVNSLSSISNPSASNFIYFNGENFGIELEEVIATLNSSGKELVMTPLSKYSPGHWESCSKQQ